MDIVLRSFVIITSLLIFFSVVSLLIKRRLNESNSILWLLIAVVILLFGIFPGITTHIAGVLGIDYPPALIFLAAIMVLLLIVFYSSIGISKMRAEINELAITVSILKEENNLMKEEIGIGGGEKVR